MNKETSERTNTVFQNYFKQLTEKQRERFAKSAGTTVRSIMTNYLRPIRKPHKSHNRYYQSTNSQPSSKRMLAFVRASKGDLNYEDVLKHFYLP